MKEIKRIALEGLPNTRDLGGFPTKDGKTIVPCRLIRSGTLYTMTESDCWCLTQKHGLKSIIDFRTLDEYNEKPDPVISKVTSYHVPVLEDVAVGITHEEKTNKESFEHTITQLISQGISGEDYMQNIYREIISGAHANNAYHTFFDLLLSQETGAALWHCSAGKDRVGIGTALLLSALGVERELIVKDFLMTNEFLKEETEQLLLLISKKTQNSILLDCVRTCMTVKESYIFSVFDYIETHFATVDNYLEQCLGLTLEKRDKLRALYLH